MATNFKKYPLWMHHPNHEKAVIEMEDGPEKGLFKAGGKQVKAERFPPQLVTKLEEEQEWAAKGYLPANCADAQEYARTILDGQLMQSNSGGAYPKWKYSPTEIPLIVNNKKEEDALEGVWFDTPSEAQEYEEPEELETKAVATKEVPAAVIEKAKVDKRLKANRTAKK